MNDKQSTNFFLSGITVGLREPDIENDILNGEWHTWFNDPAVTKFLVHGVFPVSRDKQISYISNELEKSSSLIFSIIHIESNKHIGVVSLKNIDLVNRTAEIGIVMGPYRIPGAPAIEAMTLLMKHAFDRLNLDLLYAGQHEGLWKWVNTLSTIGFKIDGFRANAGVRDNKSYGVYLTSVKAEDFNTLEKQRNGKILGDSVDSILKKRPRNNQKENILTFLKAVNPFLEEQ